MRSLVEPPHPKMMLVKDAISSSFLQLLSWSPGCHMSLARSWRDSRPLSELVT